MSHRVKIRRSDTGKVIPRSMLGNWCEVVRFVINESRRKGIKITINVGTQYMIDTLLSMIRNEIIFYKDLVFEINGKEFKSSKHGNLYSEEKDKIRKEEITFRETC